MTHFFTSFAPRVCVKVSLPWNTWLACCAARVLLVRMAAVQCVDTRNHVNEGWGCLGTPNAEHATHRGVCVPAHPV